MKIIYLSGIDGCGKTTQAKLLVEGVCDKGIKAEYVWFRWEPSVRRLINSLRSTKTKRARGYVNNLVETENNEQGDWLVFKRKILANPSAKQLWLFYACMDYYLAYRKLLKKNLADVVVMDRYINDFIIDQSINLNIPPGQSDLIDNNFFLKKFHFPDYNIIIDLPAKEGYTRKNDGTSLAYLETRENYYKAITNSKTVHLDGLESIDKLATQIQSWVFQKLKVTS